MGTLDNLFSISFVLISLKIVFVAQKKQKQSKPISEFILYRCSLKDKGKLILSLRATQLLFITSQ